MPWFRHLHIHLKNYEFEVLYLTLPDADRQGTGFGHSFHWDIPMFDGYSWIKVADEHIKGDLELDKFFSLRLKHPGRLLQEIKPDAVLITGWQCMALIQLLGCCRKLKIPCLVRAESNNLKSRAGYKRLIHRLLLNQYDRFLAIGRANRNFYLAHHVNDEHIFNCPYFVDNGFFKKSAESCRTVRAGLRQRWHIEENAFCFCYVGKLNTKKRILDILNAFKKLSDDTVCLLVIGDGLLMHDANIFANRHNLNVRFTGFLNQTELPCAYSVSHCLILASDYEETWGLVVNEAMACGLPAIVSRRCGCHPDLIREGITGYSFDFGNIEELASKMRTIKSLDRQQYAALSVMAQKHVETYYSMDVASAGLNDALKSVF